MNPQEYSDRLSQISATLDQIATILANKEHAPLFMVSPADVRDAQQLINDVQSFNNLQKDHSGSFMGIKQVRPMNDRYNSFFAGSSVAEKLPLFITQFWSVDADKLNILTSYQTNDRNPIAAKTIRIYPGIVTKAEDDTMDEGDARFTFIFTAVGPQDQPIRNENLSDSIKDRIRRLPSGDLLNEAAEEQFDALEEIGTCKPPPPCTSL